MKAGTIHILLSLPHSKILLKRVYGLGDRYATPSSLAQGEVGWNSRVIEVEGLANVTSAYGLLSRMQGRDKDLYLAIGLDSERNLYRFSEGTDQRDFSPNA